MQRTAGGVRDRAAIPLPTTTEPTDRYRHEAVFYAGTRQYLELIVPFLRAGVAAREPTLVAVPRPRLDRLRDALGAEAAHVQFIDMAELGANPARIIPRWQVFAEESAGRPIRGVGEPIWHQRRPDELVECQLHEALLNLAVPHSTPLTLLCPYDLETLPLPVLRESEASHPHLIDGEGSHDSRLYGGDQHVRDLFGAPLPEPDPRAAMLAFSADNLSRLCRWLMLLTQAAGLGTSRARTMSATLTDIAGESVEYAGGGGELRVWRSGDSLIGEVTEQGPVRDPLLGRSAVEPAGRGRGLWLANQVCDLTQLRDHGGSTVVRVHSYL
jgi:hypothetical protein